MVNIDELRFDEKGLIPAVVVDTYSKKVLTVAYMNKESLAISMKEGRTCFWSRSRQELWRKGETSGNVQHIVSITADCDRDALTVEVVKEGPACHLGTESCFSDFVYLNPAYQSFSVDGLVEMLEGRKKEKPEGSYTTLFAISLALIGTTVSMTSRLFSRRVVPVSTISTMTSLIFRIGAISIEPCNSIISISLLCFL